MEIKKTNGPRRCATCGEVMPALPGPKRLTTRCLTCLRAETEAPPYPCTGCEHEDNLSCMRHRNLIGCEAWMDWAMITWRLTTEALKKRCGGK